MATSRIAVLEVSRAAALANPNQNVRVAAATVRTLGAIHLASALRVEPDELLAYDRRLMSVAADHGLKIASPR